LAENATDRRSLKGEMEMRLAERLFVSTALLLGTGCRSTERSCRAVFNAAQHNVESLPGVVATPARYDSSSHQYYIGIGRLTPIQAVIMTDSITDLAHVVQVSVNVW